MIADQAWELIRSTAERLAARGEKEFSAGIIDDAPVPIEAILRTATLAVEDAMEHPESERLAEIWCFLDAARAALIFHATQDEDLDELKRGCIGDAEESDLLRVLAGGPPLVELWPEEWKRWRKTEQ